MTRRINPTDAPLRGALRRLRLPFSVVLVCFSFAFAQLASAANERTLTFHNINTGETTSVTYKRNGQYIPEGLTQINYVLRDWRQNEPAQMDPRLLDLVWELYQQTGSRAPINVISAYRSPTTNEMLRANSNGVAQNSQHIQGRAIDVQFPDVSLTTLRNVALRMQIGGVGFYPGSGVPFVHVDTGSVRHWPRLTRNELASVFPDGHSLHIPSDGTPLPGYNEAQIAYEARGEQVVALFGVPSDQGNTRLATLFDRDPDPQPAAAAPVTVAAAPAAVAATVAPTLITTAPSQRPDLPGITVAEADPRADTLAFAPEATTDHDPLQILNQPEPTQTAALTTPMPSIEPELPLAPAIQRRWYDPIATVIIPPTRVGSTLPFLSQTTTTRQAGFAQLTLPYVEASPQFLAMPERVIEGGFLRPSVVANSSQFTIAEGATPRMIDLTRLGTVAQR